MFKNSLTRSVSVAAWLVAGAAVSFCQCPVLTGPGNFPRGVTVYVGGVYDPVYGWPDILPPTTALQSWSNTLGAGITFVPVFFGLPTGLQYWVKVQYFPLGYSGGRTSWSGGTSTMLINDAPDANGNTLPDALQQFYAHEAGHSFGAAECGGCGAWVTIMDGSYITAANASAPLPCDQELMSDDEGYGTQYCYAEDYDVSPGDDACYGFGWCVASQNCEEGNCGSGCCLADNSGGGSGECESDDDCPGCQGCYDGTCIDEDYYCPDYGTDGGSTCSGACCVRGDDGGGDGGGGDCYPPGNGEFESVDGCDCEYGSDCASGWCSDGKCGSTDPVIVDLSGAGFLLTDAEHGVKFDFFGDGKPIQMAWTAAGAHAGWLALDRNGNGRIDNGSELFSNVTRQAGDRKRPANGFNALADYDLPANGGNGDGVIDEKDAVFPKLRVWVDSNHNGITDPGELLSIEQAGIKSISLKYAPSKWTDAYGNQFRYRSHITFTRSVPAKDLFVYDVILMTVH